jgi:hypothetical protein
MLFDLSENIFDENKIAVSRIFYMYKSWHKILQRPETIIPQKGKHHVGTISSLERGQNMCMHVCM